MLRALLKNLVTKAGADDTHVRRLHIGGKVRKDGWEVLNAVPGPHVDHVGDAKDLDRFADAAFSEVYASHVLEHLDFTGEMQTALREWCRVLAPGGRLYVAVPDLAALSALFLTDKLTLEDRFSVMRMIYGAHEDRFDYHKVGFDFEILRHFLKKAGFVEIERVASFGLFDDTSGLVCAGIPISLNVVARRRAVADDASSDA